MSQEIPINLPRNPEGDFDALVSNMTETELKGLVLQNFRMLQEVTEFTRQLTQAIAELQSGGGMMSKLIGGALGGNGKPAVNPLLAGVPGNGNGPAIPPAVLAAARAKHRR